MISLKGCFLIASPHLDDPNFRRSVVLMMEHNAEGALGLILNRPATATAKEFWKEVEQADTALEGPIFLGGPVEGPVICLHTHAEWNEGEIVPGVFVAARRELVRKLITESGVMLRVFVGYAGWGPNQLDGELEAGGWLTLPADKNLVFHPDSGQIWQQALRSTGRRMYQEMLGRHWFPDDPTEN